MKVYRALAPFRSLRRFFLLWLGALYLWGLFDLLGRGGPPGTNLPNCTIIPVGADGCLLRYVQGAQDHVQAILLFTVLLLCQGIVVWGSASGARRRRLSWWSMLLQALLACLVFFSGPPPEVGGILLLVLTLEGVTLLERTRWIVVVAWSSFVLFLVILLASLHQWRYLLPLHLSDLASLLTMLLLLGGFLVLYVQLTTSYAALEVVHQGLADTHAQLQASADRIEELTRLTERQRLARELHDTLAQGLAGVMMQLQAANLRLKSQRYERAQAAIQQAMRDVRETLSDARRAIDERRAETGSEQDLCAAVEEKMRHFTLMTGIACTSDLSACSNLPEPLGEQLLKIVSEGLMNVARHAQATRVGVRVMQEGSQIVLEVQDDGVGFDPTVVAHQPGHYGLLGLRERARLMQGVLHLESQPKGGTTLRVCFPAPAGRAEYTEHVQGVFVPGESEEAR
jgi:NarL family two-component system sensor histidine kinase YdfH